MLPPAADPLDHVFVFDGYRLDPSRRSLFRGDAVVPLGSRALELLIALIEQAGEILSREHLTARVWPKTIVEESSLRVHMAALRRALGDGQDGRRYIATIPGRGYGFVADVARQVRGLALVAPPGTLADAAPETPPIVQTQRQARLVGRERALCALTRLVEQHRLVTVVGPGGVGKTSLALHWAKTSAPSEVRIVDLSRATDEAEVLRSLAAAVGAPNAQNRWAAAVDLLRASPCLLVIDSCEHVIDAAAHLIEALLAELPELRLLATSREPLCVEGEHLYRLGMLELPCNRPTRLEQALESPAVRLLIERARASGNDVDFGDEDALALSELARQLDGLPLALELGAARVRAVGLQDMLKRPDELNGLLTRGWRTALPRHRSLEATIGWSYDLLDDDERGVLRALSVFPGSFCLSSVAGVVAPAAARPGTVEEQVLRLVDKSLVLIASAGGDCKRYRLARTTRRYAATQLQARPGEARKARAGHALELLHRIQASRPLEAEDTVAELQQALAWCFAGADEALGVRLLHAGLPLIRQQGRTAEFEPHIESARALGAGPGLVAPMLRAPVVAAQAA